jgi:alpha-glucosidase (family GH31 glycosyl hydrolase)
MTTPIVYQGQEKRDVYFPGNGETWYQFQLNTHSGKVEADKIAKFEGKTKQVIINPLPSPPPTFLRAGYMLFTNYPENRSLKLNSLFSIFAALKEDQAYGSILGIENYND